MISLNMKRIFFILALLLNMSAWAQTKVEVETSIDTTIVENGGGKITPSLLRFVLRKMVDYSANKSPNLHTHTTEDLTDWTAAWAARFAAQSTSGLSEGSNLYYTDSRVQTFGDGRYGRLGAANSWTGNNTFGGSVSATHAVTLPMGAQWVSYNTSDQATNFERVRGYWNANIYSIMAEASGTGGVRAIVLGNTTGRNITLDNFPSNVGIIRTDFGSVATSISGYGVTGSLISSTNIVQAASSIVPTINQSSTAGYRGIFVSPYEQAVGSGSKLLLDLGTNSSANGSGVHTSRFYVDNQGHTYVNGYLLLGTTTKAGYKLDVNGTARVSGDLTVTGNLSPQTDNTGSLGAGGRAWNSIASITITTQEVRERFNGSGLNFVTNSSSKNVARLFPTTGNFHFQDGGTFTDIPSARVAINSTSQGFLPPRMTTANINAIVSPATGLMAYNTDLNTLCFYNGTSWQKVTSTSMN